MLNVSKQTQLAQYNNSWYNPGPRYKIILWTLISALFFNNSLAISNRLKCFLLRAFGATIGKGVVIKPSVTIKYPWFITVGNYVWIGERVWIDNLTMVNIGNNVCISQGAYLLTGNHDYKKDTFDLIIRSITLEDGVWIGAKSTVCPGVTCNTHAVLAVNSVATKDLNSYCIYQGNPAIRIKPRMIG